MTSEVHIQEELVVLAPKMVGISESEAVIEVEFADNISFDKSSKSSKVIYKID